MESNINLSPEDLIAGINLPAEKLESENISFKSPDQFLSELSQRNPNAEPPIATPTEIFDQIPHDANMMGSETESTQKTKITVDSYEIKFTRQTTKVDSFDQIQLYYETELAKWQEYGRQMQAWIQEVNQAVSAANDRLMLAHNAEQEIDFLKKELRLRETELQSLKEKEIPESPIPLSKPVKVFSFQDLI